MIFVVLGPVSVSIPRDEPWSCTHELAVRQEGSAVYICSHPPQVVQIGYVSFVVLDFIYLLHPTVHVFCQYGFLQPDDSCPL